MTSTDSPAESSTSSDSDWGRRLRLVQKELRETLRDRRTILTLLLMPVLAYPLLGVAFQRLLITQLTSHAAPHYFVAAPTADQGALFEKMFLQGERIYESREKYRRGEDVLEEPPPESPSAPAMKPRVTLRQPDPEEMPFDVERMVAAGIVDVGVIIEKPARFGRRMEESGVTRLIYVDQSPSSRAAFHYIADRLEILNASYLNDLAGEVGRPRSVVDLRVTEVPAAQSGNAVLASLIPLVLLLMTVTGAVYPAIDLTAGERERHTLETLIAAPISRLGVLCAKYVAVVTVAILTAGINILAMLLTMQAVGLEKSVFGEQGLTWGSVFALLGLLSVFAAFFSAVLLCLTSVARSFKEAQAYLIPLMLLSLAPGVASLVPGIELGPGFAVVPLLNMVLLARSTVLGTASAGLAWVVIGSTMVYGLAALAVAARVFGSDAVLAGSSGRWSDLFRRPDRRTHITVDVAAGTFAVIFPLFFIVGSMVGRFENLSVSTRLMLNGGLTIALFAAWPLVVAAWRRCPAKEAFRLSAPPAWAMIGAVVAGMFTWPLVHEVAILQQQLGISTLGQEQIDRAKGILEAWKDVPLGVVLISLAVIPPVCEELAFRGFLFGALRRRMSGVATVLITALAFGCFHLLVAGTLAVERFLPSTLLGIVMGLLALWSGSVWPGMVFHILHNGVLMLIARFPEALQSRGLDMEGEQHLPTTWLAASAAALVVGMVLARVSRRESQ